MSFSKTLPAAAGRAAEMGSFPHRPYGPERRELPPAAWPPDLRAAWEAARRPAGFLEARRPAAGWSPATWRRVERGCGGMLNWLTRTGRFGHEADPASWLTPGNIAAFVEDQLAINAARTVITKLDSLALLARALQLEGDYRFLLEQQRRLRHRVRDRRGKTQRLRPTDELVALGLDLMDAAPQAGRRLRHAVRYRDGLMIALLARRPLRAGNFRALTLGRHVVRRGEDWWLLTPAEETKNRRPIEEPLPAALLPHLERYLVAVRPALLRRRAPASLADEGRLWLGANGFPLTERRLQACIAERTAAAFGRSLCPHLFRDAAATTIALEDPEHVRVAGQVLWHASFATTERYYRQSRSAEATRVCHEVLEALRRPEGG